MRVSEFFENHYRPERIPAAPRSTVGTYRAALAGWTMQLNRPPELADFTDAAVGRLMAWRAERGSAATANRDRRHLLSLWRTAHQLGMVDRWPRVRPARELQRLPVAWTVTEVGRLLEVAGGLEHRLRNGLRAADFWRALILTAYDTGVRRAALLEVGSSSWRPDDRTILFPAHLQKQRSDQLLPVSPETAAALELVCRAEPGRLLGWPYDRGGSYTTATRLFRSLVISAGLDPSRKLFHRIRRTRASYGEHVSPGSATRDLGHSSSAVTRAYLDPSIVGLVRTVDLLPRPIIHGGHRDRHAENEGRISNPLAGGSSPARAAAPQPRGGASSAPNGV